MTAKEIESKITVKCVDGTGALDTCVTARLELEIVGWISNALPYRDQQAAIVHLQDNLREQLMRVLFEDQRHELYAALLDLFRCPPFGSFEEISQARSRLLSAALRQPRPDV